MKHQFALYCDSLPTDPSLTPGSVVAINDRDLIRRITSILRYKPGQEIILFNDAVRVVVTLQEITKKKITCLVQTVTKNEQRTPTLIALLPLLKRESMEQALYAAVELGASVVQPVVTGKSLQRWTVKEQERYHRIMIAAAEQSKNFYFPILKEPVDFITAQKIEASVKIFFDPSGRPLLEILNEISEQQPDSLLCLVGPEGDLTSEEKEMLHDNFVFCSLTPTVLRAYQAFVVGLGALRSLRIQ